MKEEQKEKQERFLIGVNPYANEFFVFRGEGVTDEGLEDWIEETLEDCDDMKATVFDRSQAERAFYDLGLTLGLYLRRGRALPRLPDDYKTTAPYSERGGAIMGFVTCGNPI
ncbi:MAG: hypothetical protein ACREOP_06290, partial [Thermodesulfobacteriota bacterium]